MKRLKCVIAVCLLVSLSISAQKVNCNKNKIEEILQESYDCAIELESINDQVIRRPTVRLFGVPVKWMECDYPSVEISYIVERDPNGSKYRRILYIPVYFFNKKSFTDDDFCYYEDRCLGRPRFDTQGGKFHPSETIIKILPYIYIK